MKKFLSVMLAVCVLASGCGNEGQERRSGIENSTENSTGESTDNSTGDRAESDTGTEQPEWLKNAEFYADNEQNPQSNMLRFGRVIENKDFILFADYVYSKKDHKVSGLCKNPTCDHGSYRKDCLIGNTLYAKQVYEDGILCTQGGSSKIYELDPEVGELKERYDVGMECGDFRMVGKDLAVVDPAEEGFYIVDLSSGEKVQIMKAELYNAFFTIEGEYLYVSLEDLSLHRVSLRGEGDALLAEKAGSPTVYNQYVYYISAKDDNWVLRRVDIDGEKDSVVLEDVIEYAVYKDRIYYKTASYPRKQMMCNLDGSEKKELMEGEGSFFVLQETGKMFFETYLDTGAKFYTMDLDGENLQVLYEEKRE